MNHTYPLTAMLFTCLMITSSSAKEPIPQQKLSTSSVYTVGRPILIHLDYKGGLENWDGKITISEDKKTLTCSNNVYLSLRDSSGKELKGHVDYLHADMIFRKPFRTTFDLTKIFDLQKRGRYTLVWGSLEAGSSTQTIVIHREKPISFQLVVTRKTADRYHFNFYKMDKYFRQQMLSKHEYSRKWDGNNFIIGMTELPSHLEGILKLKIVNDKKEKIAIGKLVDVVNKKVR